MPRRQILSSEEKERLLIVPDDDVFLTRMCFLSAICEDQGFLPTKVFHLTTVLSSGWRLI